MEVLKAIVKNPRRVWATVTVSGAIAGILGWAIHLGLAYADGFHTRTNEFVGMWCSLVSFIIAVHSSWILLRKDFKLEPLIERKNLMAKIIYFSCAAILGFMTFVSYAVIHELACMWALTWTLYSIPAVYTLLQKQKHQYDAINQSEDTEKEICFRRSKVVKILQGIGLFWVSVVMILLTYQAISCANDARLYPYPGKLYPIEAPHGGTYRLHLHCTGTKDANSVTWVLEAGGGTDSTSYMEMQQVLTEQYGKRVCSYDRAGGGWSDSGLLPRRNQLKMQELKNILSQEGEEGPFYLVGHSVGGQLVQSFAKYYPDSVVGLAMLDSYPDDYVNFTAPAYGYTPSQIKDLNNQVTKLSDALRALSVWGISRWFMSFPSFQPKDKEGYHNSRYYNNINWNGQYSEWVAGQRFPEDNDYSDVTINSKPLVMIMAGMTVNATCEQKKLEVGSKACDMDLKAQSLYYNAGLMQAQRLSPSNHTVYVCPAPCQHDMVWANVTYLIPKLLSAGF